MFRHISKKALPICENLSSKINKQKTQTRSFLSEFFFRKKMLFRAKKDVLQNGDTECIFMKMHVMPKISEQEEKGEEGASKYLGVIVFGP